MIEAFEYHPSQVSGPGMEELRMLGTEDLVNLYKTTCKKVYGLDRYCQRIMSKRKDFPDSTEGIRIYEDRKEFTDGLSAIADTLLWRQIKELGLQKNTQTGILGRERTYLITYNEKTNACLGIDYDPEIMATSYALIVDGDTFFEDEVRGPPNDIMDRLVTVALLPESILYDLQEVLSEEKNRKLSVYDAVEIVLSRKNTGRLDKIKGAISQRLS